jgi:tRNA dimethylallyltransferase
VEIAESRGWEIISCDSRQVYKGMDIGTAKPDSAQRRRVRHWLVDLLDPDVSYSAFDFARDAGAIVRERAALGRRVLVCGGTGLYFEGLRKGIAPQTATDPAIRARLTERAGVEGSGVLYAELSQIDPVSAHRIHANDLQRIVRALAVYEQTGVPMSELRRRTRPPEDLAFTVAVVLPPRETLFVRIDKRVDDMVGKGLYEEFELLRERGFDESSPGMQCIGYRELFGVRNGECSMAAAIESIKYNTRQYARRQYTWFTSHNRKETVSWSNDWLILVHAVSERLDHTSCNQEKKNI